VAALKPVLEGRDLPHHRVLHGEFAVAALKRSANPCRDSAPRAKVLHGEFAVAALKQPLRTAMAALAAGFSTANSPWPH